MIKSAFAISCLLLGFGITAAAAAPDSAIKARGKSSVEDPNLKFLRSKFGFDANANPGTCTIRKYIGPHQDVRWRNNVDLMPENQPEHILSVLLLGLDVTRSLPLGVVQFPEPETHVGDRLNAVVGPWTEKNDWRTFWTFSPFPTRAVHPDTVENGTIANDFLVRANSQDATTNGKVTSRWVKIDMPAAAVRTCSVFVDACPCVSTTPQSINPPAFKTYKAGDRVP